MKLFIIAIACFGLPLLCCLPCCAEDAAQATEAPPQWKLTLQDSNDRLNSLQARMNTLKEDSRKFQAQLKVTRDALSKSQLTQTQILQELEITRAGLKTSYEQSLQSYQNEITNLKTKLFWQKILVWGLATAIAALGGLLIKKMILPI